MINCTDLYGYVEEELLKPAKEPQLQGRKLHVHLGKTSKHGDLFLQLSGRQQSQTDQETEFLVDQVRRRPALADYVKNIQQRSVGSLAVFLRRDVVLRQGLKAVLENTRHYGRCDDTQTRDILIVTHLHGQSGEDASVSLNALRTALIAMHLGQVLRYTGHHIKHVGTSSKLSDTGQSLLSEFGYESCFKPEQTLFESTLHNLREKLCSTEYVLEDRDSVENGAAGKDKETDQISCSKDPEKLLDLKKYIKENRLNGYDSNIKTVKGLESDGRDGPILAKVADLECCVQTALSQQCGDSPVPLMVHVSGCNRTFQAQQYGLSWQIITEVNPQPQQTYLSHSAVVAAGDLDTSDTFSAEKLFRLRVRQMLQSYHVKYGDQVKGSDWEAAIRGIAQAVIKLEILSVNLKTPVKIDSSDTLETPADCRDALFALYNCARLAKLFQHYEEMVLSGTYPPLPAVQDVDFKLLREEEEWELYLKYIFTFPSLLKEISSSLLTSESAKANYGTHKVCTFLIALSRAVSSYYSRVHVLGESRPHLFPVMFARLFLLKAVHQVMCSCLNLLAIDPPTQM